MFGIRRKYCYTFYKGPSPNEPLDVFYLEKLWEFWLNHVVSPIETRIFRPDASRFQMKMNIYNSGLHCT